MLIRAVILAFVFGLSGCAAVPLADERAALAKTSADIRAAFARGDVDGVMAYHHPNVVKALSPTKYLEGRDAVAADLRGTLQAFALEFVENHTESLLVQGDTAVEIARFVIRLTPRSGGATILFKGRAMIVYVRESASPSGWASIREIIQPAAS
jgi:ketosteroid isomerase-like protein